MARSWKALFVATAARQRRRLRESEAAFILLATIAGLAAGLLTNVQAFLAHSMQRLFYGVTINRLSALGSIHHPWKLLALPLGNADPAPSKTTVTGITPRHSTGTNTRACPLEAGNSSSAGNYRRADCERQQSARRRRTKGAQLRGEFTASQRPSLW